MRASVSGSIAIPTLLLLASAAVAQDTTTSVSVVTSPFVSPSPTDEQVYTIQTDTTAVGADPWACYQNCFMPPCPPCSSGSGINSATPIPLPRPISESVVSEGSGINSATPIPLPRPISESVVSEITDASLSTVSGFMSIPVGETPISSGAIATSSASGSPTASSSSAGSSAPTRVTSGLPQATSNAAALNAKADQIPLVAAIAGALVLL